MSPSTLRAWEQRFGFPLPERSPGGHRLYRHGDVAALRDALEQGLSISSAISRVRQGHGADAEALIAPLAAFDAEGATRALEAALVLRSVERTIEEVLLPALGRIAFGDGLESVPWAFAASWADDWLRWAHRLALHPRGQTRLLVADATDGELDPDRAHVRALDLFCTRAGARSLLLPVHASSGLTRAARRFDPTIVVIAGEHAPEAEVTRWASAVRTAVACPIALYRCEGRARRAPRMHVLDPSALTAQRELLALGG